jgi:hypothetical protein
MVSRLEGMDARFSELTEPSPGGTARIGPSTVITSSENFIRKSNAARGTYRRGFWFSAFKFDADYENVFSERDEEKHTAMRAKLAAGVRFCTILMRCRD